MSSTKPHFGLSQCPSDSVSLKNHGKRHVSHHGNAIFSRVPSSKLTWLAGKSPCLVGDTSSKGLFCIAMLVYRSVTVEEVYGYIKWRKKMSPYISFLVNDYVAE